MKSPAAVFQYSDFKMAALCWLLLLLPVLAESQDGRHFLGVGYNLLLGNPDGGDDVAGGVDPGLFITRKVLEVGTASQPPELVWEPRQSCVVSHSVEVFYGAKSYQSKLGLAVSLGGGAIAGLVNAAFSLSPKFRSAQNSTNLEHYVYRDDVTVCNLGRARYALEMASARGFNVTSSFAQAVSQLPLNYSRPEYMAFLDSWGTHVTMELDMGVRKIERSRAKLSQFMDHLRKEGGVGVSLGGSYMGAGASLGVDFDQFKASDVFKTQFGSFQHVLQSGSPEMPEPIHMTINPIADVMVDELWTGRWGEIAAHAQRSALPVWRAHLHQALTEYAAFKMAPSISDPLLRVPLHWPRGTYGLMRASTGCPGGHVTWETGSRWQDTDNIFNKNRFSENLHLSGDFGRGDTVRMDFCIKGVDHVSEFDLQWPPGDYCLLKYGPCPQDFQEGFVQWDDANFWNSDKVSGTLPDGKYDKNTRIDYCCRNDSLPTQPLELPMDRPFFLMRHSRGCQQVTRMHLIEEWVELDEEDFLSHSAVGGDHPLDDGAPRHHRLHFCYYTPLSSSVPFG